jgi:hypothetical protein
MVQRKLLAVILRITTTASVREETYNLSKNAIAKNNYGLAEAQLSSGFKFSANKTCIHRHKQILQSAQADTSIGASRYFSRRKQKLQSEESRYFSRPKADTSVCSSIYFSRSKQKLQ